jgi:hypothetical protein
MKKLKSINDFEDMTLNTYQMMKIIGGTNDYQVTYEATGPYNGCSSDEKSTLSQDGRVCCVCIEACC